MICTGGVYGGGPRKAVLLQTALVEGNEDSGVVSRTLSGGNAEEEKSLTELIRLHRPPFFFSHGIVCLNPR